MVSLSLFFAAVRSADADGALLSAGNTTPIEERVAIAAGPDRTTIWTSLRLDADAGPIALVIPVPPGASLDTSTDAWFEALEIATAPRVFPPQGVPSVCSESLDPGEHFHVAGSIGHDQTLPPAEVKVLADADAVAAWAANHALPLSLATKDELAAFVGSRFLIARFEATGQTVITRTLRVVVPGVEAALPLTLTRATSKDLKITTWLLGPGRGEIIGAKSVAVPAAKISWNASTSESTYATVLADALTTAGADGAALEAAGHDPIAVSVPIDEGKASISSVIATLFERAADYGDGAPGTAACVAQAAAALASITPVAASCPRADLGVVDGVDTCTEAPAGLTDPAALRCGDGADDLAVALSGLVPADAWLTRQSMMIAKGKVGSYWSLSFGPGAEASAVRTAGSVDMSACEAPDAGSSSSSGGSSSGGSSGSTSSGGSTTGSSGGSTGSGSTDVYVDTSPGCDCSGTADTVDPGPDPNDPYYNDPYYNDSSDDCSGDTTDTTTTSGDDCSGDTTDTSGGSTSDDCAGDTTDTSGGSTSDDCAGDTTDTSGGSGDSCSSDTSTNDGSDNCSGDTSTSDSCDSDTSGSGDWGEFDARSSLISTSGGTCAVAPARGVTKRRSPKLSAMTLSALALLLPFRRAGTRKRQRGSSTKASKA